MGHIYIAVFVLLASFAMEANASVNVQSFHNRNFNPVGSGWCGLHVEVSGSTVVFTNIIPPRDYDSIGDGCGSHSYCEGTSFALECRQNGQCYNQDKELILQLLSDGNIFHYHHKVKLSRSSSGTYYTCN